MKRLLTLFLAFTILVSSASLTLSCAGKAAPTTGQPTTAADNGEVQATTNPNASGIDNLKAIRAAVSDDLPAKDYGGSDFNILVREHERDEFGVTSEIGEIVNDALYYRNKTVEERFNVKINAVPIKGTWDDQASFMNTIKKAVQAGDSSYDLVAGYAAYITKMASSGYLLNWRDVPNVNFDKPWWSQSSAEQMDVNGRLYFVTGDMALTMWKYLFVLYFNKQLVKDFALDDPYTLVKEGKWTLDKMAEMTRAVSRDVNGDGKMDQEDLYGYVTDSHNLVDVFHAAFDVPVTTRGDDGFPKIAIGSAKYYEAFNRLYDFLRRSASTFTGTEQTGVPESVYRPMFENGRALILPEYLGNVQILRSLELDFGILPFPKYDENQANYHGAAQDGYSLFCIPASAADPEKVGIISEALCAESYKQVIPVYYEVALKTKYARDNESSAMIDLVRDGITFNFGTVNSQNMEGPGHIWRTSITDQKPDIVSAVEKKINAIDKGLEKLLQGYTD